MCTVTSGSWTWPKGTMSKANFTREQYIDHLQRYAYHGVAATISTGTDLSELA